MKNSRWLFILYVLLAACTTPQVATPSPTTPPSITPTATHTPSPTPTITPTSKPEYIYTTAFGIDYANPEKYLAPGDQTHISSPEVLDSLRSDQKSISHLQSVYLWKEREFEPYSAGGGTIGVVTVDQLLEERHLGGCNDHALVFISVVRELGYPAVFVNTNSIAWMELYQAGEAKQYVGHIFAEVYVDGKWVLIDSTGGHYVEEGYDPTNPVIPLKGAIAGSSEEIYGFYVINKGIDEWDLGIHRMKDIFAMMKEVADQVVLESLVYPAYTFEHFK
jgi:transglutaminase-like putative cysteine protease